MSGAAARRDVDQQAVGLVVVGRRAYSSAWITPRRESKSGGCGAADTLKLDQVLIREQGQIDGMGDVHIMDGLVLLDELAQLLGHGLLQSAQLGHQPSIDGPGLAS